MGRVELGMLRILHFIGNFLYYCFPIAGTFSATHRLLGYELLFL